MAHPSIRGGHRGARHLLKQRRLLWSLLCFHILGKHVYIHSHFAHVLYCFPSRSLMTHLAVAFPFSFLFSHNIWVPCSIILAAAVAAEKFGITEDPEKQVWIVFLQNRHFLAVCWLLRARITLFRLVMDWVLLRQQHHHAHALHQRCLPLFRSGCTGWC